MFMVCVHIHTYIHVRCELEWAHGGNEQSRGDRDEALQRHASPSCAYLWLHGQSAWRRGIGSCHEVREEDNLPFFVQVQR